jgi:hypothetical protein
MTLTEYLNQDNPVKMPNVLIESGEYKMGHFYGAIGAKVADIRINGIGFYYCVKQDSNIVYTTDTNGNPKAPSCFIIKG